MNIQPQNLKTGNGAQVKREAFSNIKQCLLKWRIFSCDDWDVAVLLAFLQDELP